MRVLLAVLVVLLALPAAAQDWPTRPIRLISPFAPGGSNDVTARLMAPRMSARLGQPVVVETRSGAGGMTGVDLAAKAPADGYTIVLGTTGAVITAPLLSANRPFDAARDLAAITQAINVQVPVVVPARSPYRSLPDLLAAARANPGRLTFGSSGTGSLPHLSGELIRITAKVEMTHVPYRGGAPAAMAVAAAEVDLALSDLPVFMPLVKDGQARILAVGAPQRMAFLPEVPTLGELGMPNIDTNNWHGLLTGAGVPQAILDRLNEAAVAALRDPEVVRTITDQGMEVVANPREVFAARIRADLATWSGVMRQVGLKPE